MTLASDVRLSAKQAALLDYWRTYYLGYGIPPTIHEAVEALGISSSSVCVYNINALIDRGLLVRAMGEQGDHSARAIVPTGFRVIEEG